MDLAQAKRAARQAARARRAACHRAAPAGAAGRAVAGNFLAEPRLASLARPGAVVAGYHPMGDEADCLPLLQELARLGVAIALPVVVAANQPLAFRAWDLTPGTLRPGPYDTRQPAPDAPTVEPAVFLVPLLAFDAAGFRLGYGGGYYDRTLAAAPRIPAVGIAYAGQRVPAVPHDAADVALDWVVTDTAALICGKV